jgi:hypothetical protein
MMSEEGSREEGAGLAHSRAHFSLWLRAQHNNGDSSESSHQ